MSSEIDPTFIQETVKAFIVQNYILYATLTVLVYDLATSFELEIKYFWSRWKSAVAMLYFTTRYGAILGTILQLLSNSFNTNNGICERKPFPPILIQSQTLAGRLAYFFAITDVITMLCVDYILLLRVRALYSRGKAVSIVLFSAFGINAITGLVLAVQPLSIEDPEAIGVAPGLSLCFLSAPPTIEAPLTWSIPLAYGTLLLALALYKAAAIWKEVSGLKGVSLVRVLIRDQALYYLAVIFVSFANIVADVVDISSLLSFVLDVAGNPAFLSILGARLLFNMREAGEKGLNQGTSCPTRSTVSEIDFAAPPAGAVESSVGEAAGAEEVERAVDAAAEIEEIV